MTIFDLLFLALFLAALGALLVAAISSFSRPARSLAILRRLAVGTLAYIGIVYAATALSKRVVLRVGDPQCNDDWCIAVAGVDRTPKDAVTVYEIKLRIFSRALRRAQRENGATDVYLVDSRDRRYDPTPRTSDLPLNTLLQPGESVDTGRVFSLPADAHDVGLMVGRGSLLPVCLIIGECGAFHKETMVRID